VAGSVSAPGRFATPRALHLREDRAQRRTDVASTRHRALPMGRAMAAVWLGLLLFAVVARACGVRLLGLWWRTGEQPALLIGLGVLGIGPVGFGLLATGATLGERGLPLADELAAAGSLACVVGAAAKYVFNWRVYHAQSRAVGTGTLAVVALGVVALGAHTWLHGYPAGREHAAWYLGRGAFQAACLLWGSFEALRYHAAMRRRLELGLADVVTTQRFALWGVAAGSAGIGTVVGVAALALQGAGDVGGLLSAARLRRALRGGRQAGLRRRRGEGPRGAARAGRLKKGEAQSSELLCASDSEPAGSGNATGGPPTEALRSRARSGPARRHPR